MLLEDSEKKKVTLKDALKWDKWDIIISVIALTPSVIVWIILFMNNKLEYIHISTNSIKIFAMAKHSFININGGKGCHLETPFPIVPLFLKFFWFVSIKCSTLGSIIYMTIINVMSSLLFRRYLQTLKFISINSQIILPCMLPIFPYKNIILESVVSSHILFFNLFILLLLVKLWNYPKIFFVIGYICMWTHKLGLVAIFSIGFSLILASKNSKGIFYILCCVNSIAAMSLYHYFIRGTFFPIFNSLKLQNIIPLYYMLESSFNKPTHEVLIGWMLYIIGFLSTIRLYNFDRNLGIFLFIGIIISATGNSEDPFGEPSIIESVSILLCLDNIIKRNNNPKTVLFVYILLFIFGLMLACKELLNDPMDIELISRKC